MKWGIAISARSSFAVLCALALAGALVSPAVPSPPTVVGKAVHSSVTSLALAVLPPACALDLLVPGILYLAVEEMVGAADSGIAPGLLPLRR